MPVHKNLLDGSGNNGTVGSSVAALACKLSGVFIGEAVDAHVLSFANQSFIRLKTLLTDIRLWGQHLYRFLQNKLRIKAMAYVRRVENFYVDGPLSRQGIGYNAGTITQF